MVLPYYDRTSFPLTVDDGCLVVMGDNRNRSADSRYASIGQIEESQVIGNIGNVKKSDIYGKAWFVAYPWDNFGFVTSVK